MRHALPQFGDYEDAMLTGERHIVIRLAREFFEKELGDRVKLETPIGE